MPIYASAAALAQAETLLPGKVLENEVERAILAGRKRPYALPGMKLTLARDERFVILNRRLAAVLRRTTSRLKGKKAWRIVRLVPLRPPRVVQR